MAICCLLYHENAYYSTKLYRIHSRPGHCYGLFAFTINLREENVYVPTSGSEKEKSISPMLWQRRGIVSYPTFPFTTRSYGTKDV